MWADAMYIPPPSPLPPFPPRWPAPVVAMLAAPLPPRPPMAMLRAKTVWLISMLNPAKNRPPPIASPPFPPMPPAAPMAVLFADDRVVDLDIAARGIDAAALDRRVARNRAVVDLEVAIDHVDPATLEGMASGNGGVVNLHIAADDVDAAHDRHILDDQVAARVLEGDARGIDDAQAAGSRPIEAQAPAETEWRREVDGLSRQARGEGDPVAAPGEGDFLGEASPARCRGR